MHVLIVEDDRDQRTALGLALQLRGFTVSEAAHFGGVVATFEGEDEDPDAVVTDVHLGIGPSGMDVLRHVRRASPDADVLVVTGRATADGRRAALGLGARAYLEKPVDVAKLTELLGQACASDT